MNKKLLKNIFHIVLILVIFIAPILLMAQEVKIKNPIGVDNLNDFIKTVLEAVIRIGLPLVAIALIYSGYLFVEAQGNSGKLETAKRAFVYTLLGAAILLGAWALARTITETVIQISN